MRLAILAGLFAALQGAPSSAQPPARIFSVTGYLDDAGEEDAGWIRLAETPLRFRLPANPAEEETLTRLLSAIAQRGLAFTIRYDVTSGRPDAAGGYVEFGLCSIAVGNGARFGNEAVNCPERPPVLLGPGEDMLVRGVAESFAVPEAARRSLSAALAARGFNSRLRAMAFEARGQAAESLANGVPSASEAFDQLTFEGLADYRGWAAAAPDDPEALFATARLLSDLGGYDEARATMAAIQRRWPERAIDVAIRLGALYRKQGRYLEALAPLDAYAAEFGEIEGMRYSYHRALTLLLLGRSAEALTQINRGFESQTDYPFAFFIRSCARARLGQLPEALSDQERGLELLNGRGENSPGLDEVRQTARGNIDALRRMAAAGGRRPSDLPCLNHWDRDVRSRLRISLLGPAIR